MNVTQDCNKSKIYYNDYSKEISFIKNNELSEIKNNNSSLFSQLSDLLSQIKTENIDYFCKMCNNFPSIEIINFAEIYIKCACNDNKKTKISIDKFLDPQISNILFPSNNLKEINNNPLNMKCYIHGNKPHKFRYYCVECLKNVCKECCQDHLNSPHNLIIFDYENFEIMKKIIEIKKLLEILQKKIDDNPTNDDIKGYIIEYYDKNTFKEKPNNYIQNFIKLINIIILDYSKYPNYSHFHNIDNIYRFLINQMKNSVCKIIINDNFYETGFFCEQNYGYENNNFHFLVTTSHTIKKYNNNNNAKYINIQLPNNTKLFKIEIDNSERKIYNNEKDDILFVEIKNEDFFQIKINYLQIDEDININSIDKNNKIYFLDNYENKILLFNSCIIIGENGYYFICNCSSNGVNSVGGAILSKDYKVIGINKGENNINNNTYTGLFLKPFIDNFNPVKKESNSSFIKEITYLDKYEIGELIGVGVYGEVYKGRIKNTDEFRAIKIINKKEIKEYIKYFYDEYNYEKKSKEIDNVLYDYINNMKILNDENEDIFLKYYEYYEEKDKLIIITELCDDNLYNFLEIKNSLNIDKIHNLIQILNKGFKKMNNKNIIHGNIKLENILIKYNYEINNFNTYKVKICDYGSNILIAESMKNGENSILNYCLSNCYSQKKNGIIIQNFLSKYLRKPIYPELNNIKDEKENYDLWNLGMMINKLFYNDFAFPFNEKKENSKKSNNKNFDDLINNLILRKISKWDQYFKQDFCNNNKSLLIIKKKNSFSFNN